MSFERFTERAHQIVVLAQEEARDLKHNYLGTEHLLLGMLREQEGIAARVLDSLGITVERARSQLIQIVGRGEEGTSQVPFTPRARKVTKLALREALNLGHNYIGTEHILLGLVRENQGVAARILLDLGVNVEWVRGGVMQMLNPKKAVEQANPQMEVTFSVIVHRLQEPTAHGDWLVRVYVGREHVHSVEGGVPLDVGLKEADAAVRGYLAGCGCRP